LEQVKRKRDEINIRKECLQKEAKRLAELNLSLVADTHMLDDRTKRVGLTVEDYGKKLGVEATPEVELVSVAHHDFESSGAIAGFEKKRSILRRFRTQTARTLTKKLFSSRNSSSEPKIGSLQHQILDAQKEHAYLQQLISDVNLEQAELQAESVLQEGSISVDLSRLDLNED
jgi:hypothetical protein